MAAGVLHFCNLHLERVAPERVSFQAINSFRGGKLAQKAEHTFCLPTPLARRHDWIRKRESAYFCSLIATAKDSDLTSNPQYIQWGFVSKDEPFH